MQITRLILKNWRNFRSVDVTLGPRTYVLGPNAAGKSNLLEVFRFLRTIVQAKGGGLQQAVERCGGLSRLRSLHARRDPEVRIEVEVTDDTAHSPPHIWHYVLALKSEGKGQQRPIVTQERVMLNGREIVVRPNDEDRKDPERLTQTHLEQIATNVEFRDLYDFFGATTYLHLVPQLLKHGDEISGRVLEQDPFGQGLMQRIAATPKKVRDARLRRIRWAALDKAVPLFSELRFEQDVVTGMWHLEANFKHWRDKGAWQRENQFSDGTLRLVGLLWALQDGEGLLLLEEPELSLHEEVVRRIPLLIDRVLRDLKRRATSRQVIVSTHSKALLDSVSDATILVIEPGPNGSTVRLPTPAETEQMEHGLTPAEVFVAKTCPKSVEQLGLFE
ncbi:AAA family ATPase [Tepidimonas taiwanensis]|uniref:DNA replication and repair protein RecF n=1 Tax=Tepidimonas taiwanensis TaxID=307486 RepID=A0A554XAS5_9BURK|nr:AAA family ATPase [Tepidimonas taiwanensis]MCX7672926.1 AAA family ATPase [Thiobacillaceae bacterium]TSE32935.1 DNA replication and repair protein RecF [Tepidimonas taiwanensis]UBQ04532.1 AAA family ATPase [Tepidimonas taiwanensis]